MSDDSTLYKFVPERLNDVSPEKRVEIFNSLMGRLIHWSDEAFRLEKEANDLRAQLAERERGIVRLNAVVRAYDIESSSPEDRSQEAAHYNWIDGQMEKLQSRHDSLNDFVTWLEAFTRTRGYPTGTEWVVIEAKMKDALAKDEVGHE